MRGFSIPRKLSKRVGKYQPMRDWTKLRASSTVFLVQPFYTSIVYRYSIDDRASCESVIYTC